MFNSTFGAFTTARLGMAVSQMGLNITGQNVTNIGTFGYTRQRIDQVSLNINGLEYTNSIYSVNIGQGALVTGTSQLRDPYLDKRFRTEMGYVGEYDEKVSGLKELEGILDETSKVNKDGGINNQLQDFLEKLQQLSGNTQSEEFDTMAKVSAEELTRLLNSYSKQINEVKNNIENDFQNVDIPAVNDILKNIRDLNKAIKVSQMNGDSALELKDQRNNLIDELSTYVKIDVSYRPVRVTDTTTIEELQINFVGSNGEKIPIINDDEMRQFSASKDEETGQWTIGLGQLLNDKGEVVDGTEYNAGELLASGSFKSVLGLLNGNGEFDNPPTERGINFYTKMLDQLANQFATQFNEMNKVQRVDEDGNLVFESDGITPVYDERPLFASNNDGPITASSIKIADGWANNSYGITTSKNPKEPGQDNVLEMIDLMNKDLVYQTEDGTRLFEGTFEEFYTNINSILGLEIKSNTEILKNHTTLAGNIGNAKSNVSGVSLDEEGMNMMKYSQAYAASAKMMTTLDEALDVLINKTGVVGR